VRVVEDSVALGVGACRVLDHLLVDAEVRLGVLLLVGLLVLLNQFAHVPPLVRVLEAAFDRRVIWI